VGFNREAGNREAAVAVLIPTFNEAAVIAACLRALQGAGVDEIIVSDGGSADDTVAIARRFDDVVVLCSANGRGAQLQAALERAHSTIVVLLHADTVLAVGAIPAIRAALAQPDIAGGCFRLQFDVKSATLSIYAFASRFDSMFTTFGDQAFFARRSTLLEAGGIPDWPLFEDVDVRKRLKARGRFVKLPLCVTTSARRFERLGVVRCQIRNVVLMFGYMAGISPHTLAGLYYPDRRSTRGPVSD
jgi:rSAM/selenodomain-associated transferase 2